MSIVKKVGINSWTCQTCGRDIVGRAKANTHAAVCKKEEEHVFEASAENRLYCQHCGASETEHRL